MPQSVTFLNMLTIVGTKPPFTVPTIPLHKRIPPLIPSNQLTGTFSAYYFSNQRPTVIGSDPHAKYIQVGVSGEALRSPVTEP